jgi:hypothetical protein
MFNRLINVGLAARYLSEKCPDTSIRLCAVRDQVPSDGDDWLWNDSALYREYGSWEKFEPEAARLVRDIVFRYPGAVLKEAIVGTVQQLFLLRTTDHLTTDTWHTKSAIEAFAAPAFPYSPAGRQQQGTLNCQWLEPIHIATALAAMAGLLVVVALGFAHRLPPRTFEFGATVLVALLGNAAICGTLSIPSDRYQSRLVWLAPLVVMIAAAGCWCARSATSTDPSR